jgi:hypothetical protein
VCCCSFHSVAVRGIGNPIKGKEYSNDRGGRSQSFLLGNVPGAKQNYTEMRGIEITGRDFAALTFKSDF